MDFHQIDNCLNKQKMLYHQLIWIMLIMENSRVENIQTKQRGSNSWVGTYAREEYQVDVAYMDFLNGSKKYAFVCIDSFSKKAYLKPSNTRTTEDATNFIKEAINKLGYPTKIFSDDGAEFKGNFEKFLEGERIQHTITLTHAQYAERFIKTTKKMLHDRVKHHKVDWVDIVDGILNKYNSTHHSSIDLTPNEAHDDKNSLRGKTSLTLKAKYKKKYPTIKEGDDVRILVKPRHYTDTKEYKNKLTNQVYTIEKIEMVNGQKYYYAIGYKKPLLRHEIHRLDLD